MSVIDSLLHECKGVRLVISGGGAYSHAVTAWGFSYVDPGASASIFLTDSDDNFLGLREYPLVWENNAWYLGGAYDLNFSGQNPYLMDERSGFFLVASTRLAQFR